jgi:hypothetical protein
VRGLSPPLLSDDLNYHYALPAIFAREGVIVSHQDYVHYNVPLGAEMLYTLGLTLRADYPFLGLLNVLYAIGLLGHSLPSVDEWAARGPACLAGWG